MERKELMEYIMDNVKKINDADPEDREDMLYEFKGKLIDELEGVDYMEFKDGTITNSYLNFDSNCGLSLITASIDMKQFIDNMSVMEKEGESNLAYAGRLMCEIGNRTEYWDDLIEDDFSFGGSPEDIARIIVSVMDDWVGEEEFTEEINEYMEGM